MEQSVYFIMEQAKKKKNRSKKNKQNKTTEDLAGQTSVTSAGENHVTKNRQDGAIKDTKIDEGQGDPALVVEEYHKSHFTNNSQVDSLDKSNRLIQEERDTHLLKEAFLEEQILQLRKERDMFMQKEIALEETIAQLQQEKEAQMQKEVSFQEKINLLMNEHATLNMIKVSLEKKAQQMDGEIESWLLKENSNKEAFDCLNGDILRLQKQVASLEQLRDSLLHENQLLAEKISNLEMQILNLERSVALSSSAESKMHMVEKGNVTSEIEAAHSLVEKLITENAELVEKVNALYAELKHNGSQRQESPTDCSFGAMESATNSDITLGTDTAASEIQKIVPAAELPNGPVKTTSASGEIMEIGGHGDLSEQHEVAPNSLYMIESDEKFQISLDENKGQMTDTWAVHEDEKAEVPISDAPLIGAPFRLISFVARYVSGADLVEKN